MCIDQLSRHVISEQITQTHLFSFEKDAMPYDHFSIQSIGGKSRSRQIQLGILGHFKWPTKQTLTENKKNVHYNDLLYLIYLGVK